MFQGSLVALVTPMTMADGLDEAALRDLIDWHVEQGTDGFVVLGTTGESPTITAAEREQIIRLAVEQVAGRFPVIVGTGTNSTATSVALTQEALRLGADAALLVAPYYNRPTQEGLFQHFTAVADAVALPQILYNVPSRTGCDVLPETVGRLSSHPNIVGIKEATGEVGRVKRLGERCGDDFLLLSGDDTTALAFMQEGGQGVISVVANVVPRMFHALCSAALEGDTKTATVLNEQLVALIALMGVETNPIPVKWAVHLLGLIGPAIRLPMMPLGASHRAALAENLEKLGEFSYEISS